MILLFLKLVTVQSSNNFVFTHYVALEIVREERQWLAQALKAIKRLSSSLKGEAASNDEDPRSDFANLKSPVVVQSISWYQVIIEE